MYFRSLTLNTKEGAYPLERLCFKEARNIKSKTRVMKHVSKWNDALNSMLFRTFTKRTVRDFIVKQNQIRRFHLNGTCPLFVSVSLVSSRNKLVIK